jgi:hypothetical protein
MGGIDDDYRLALGGLVMGVSVLDSKVTELIAALTEMDLADALILVHHQQPANKIDGLRALFHRIYPAEDDPQYRPVKQVLDRGQGGHGLPQLGRPRPLACGRCWYAARRPLSGPSQAYALALAAGRPEGEPRAPANSRQRP